MMRVLLLGLLLAVSGWADSISGAFVDQVVSYQGCHTCGFHDAGSIQEGINGVRVIQLGEAGWTLIPFEYQWVTHAGSWSWDGVNLLNTETVVRGSWVTSQSDEAFSDALLPLISVQESSGSVTVLFSGFVIGESVGTAAALAVPEASTLLLMLAGLGLLLARRLVSARSSSR